MVSSTRFGDDRYASFHRELDMMGREINRGWHVDDYESSDHRSSSDLWPEPSVPADDDVMSDIVFQHQPAPKAIYQPYRPPGYVSQPADAAQKIYQPYRPPGYVPQPAQPAQKTYQPYRPPGYVPQPAHPAQKTYQPYRPPGYMPQPAQPAQKIYQPYRPPGHVPQAAQPAQEIYKPYRPPGKVPQPAQPAPEIYKSYRPFGKVPQRGKKARKSHKPYHPPGKVPQPAQPAQEIHKPNRSPGKVPQRVQKTQKTHKPYRPPGKMRQLANAAWKFFKEYRTGASAQNLDIKPHKLLPPVFAKALRKRLKLNDGSEDAIRWYLEELADTDVQGSADLETILRNDSSPGTNLNAQWVAKEDIGAGVYGKVVLWERDMGYGRAPARIACKDAKFDRWFKDYSSEAQLTRRVYAAGCKNVVRVLDWAPDPKKKFTRILYEYCPYGTLYGVLYFYMLNPVTVPEAFIWHIFHSLAAVVCYHAYGTTDGTMRPGWVPIVHRDIKPENILLDEPDAHSRRLYPTLKLADYGLAYSIPNAAVRNLKRAMVSGGTEGYQAPEISYKVRSDPSQTPDPIASPASDVYSIGCVVLDFIRTAWDRYKHAEQMILELNYPFAYKYFPYSKNLVDLARISTNSDSRLRPTPKQLFDITLKYGTLSYNAIAEPDGPELARNAYPGMVMWNKRLQRRFRDNAVFRHAVLKMDWFSQNERALQKLYVVATQPGEESRPLEGRVAIGNGLGGFEDFRTLYQKYRHLDQKQWLGIMHLYDSAGNEIPCPKDRPFLGLIAQNRLQPPPQDEDWRSKRPDAKPAVYKIYK